MAKKTTPAKPTTKPKKTGEIKKDQELTVEQLEKATGGAKARLSSLFSRDTVISPTVVTPQLNQQFLA